MIEIEDLSFQEWECFEHLASQRKETRISVPVTLGHSGSIRSTERVKAEFENLDLVAYGRNYCNAQKMSQEAFSALLVGLFGICRGYAFSWDQQLWLPPFLDVNPTCCQISSPPHIPLSELDQFALDFTGRRHWRHAAGQARAADRAASTSAAHSATPASAADLAAPASTLAARLAAQASAADSTARFDSTAPGPGQHSPGILCNSK